MKFPSPLRYPGGKSSMAGLLSSIRRINDIGGMPIAEPFAGGAGASLRLLYLEETTDIYINDADYAIYSFWWTLVNRSKPFIKMLSNKRVCLSEWRRQREIYKSSSKISMLKKGFSAFYLNRCNRSGIIVDGGPIGGVFQTGKWKINARFNKSELINRCEKISEYRQRIHVSCDDGMSFIESLNNDSTFYFIDPPYYEKGPELYLNALNENYHIRLAEQLREMADQFWVLTYDDCPEIRRIYCGWANIRSFSLRYSASSQRSGKEILITPKWMRLPSEQNSLALKW